MSDQPKPTGEWTAEYVRNIGGHYSIVQQRNQAVADAHNAALATEQNLRADWNYVIEELEKQLAAEREKRELAESLFRQRDKEMTENLALSVEIEKERNQLRQQLDAARERYEALEKSILDLSHPNCQQLLKDLAAEREKVNP